MKIDPIALYNAQHAIIRYLKSSKLSVEFTKTFQQYEELRIQDTGKLSTLLSTEKFDLNRSNSQGIFLRSAKGAVIGQCALRVENLGRVALAEHWMVQQNRCYSDDGANIGTNHAPGVFRVNGQVVYFGDFYIDKKHRTGVEGKNNVAAAFGCMCQLAALTIFQPDYTYALVIGPQALNGLCTRIGFSHVEPFAAEWISTPKHAAIDEYFAYNDLQDLLHLVETIPFRFR